MRSKLVLSLLALSLLALAATPAAAKGAWVQLGTKSVTDAVDHDVLTVTSSRGDFKAIKLKVFDHAVQFRRVIVHFANGGDQEIELRDVIPAGGESRVIDLAGGDRVIRSIELRYDAQSVRGRAARVRVFARH